VWTTFSPDQVDLNFANPLVLLEIIDVLLCYLQQGARIIRLDAVAYLWKRVGTNCIHLPETHEVVKLLRDLTSTVAPGVLLLTETNVPHDENIAYFGQGDEAHMVYQFSLPPLLLDAFLSRDARPLVAWLSALDATQPGTAFVNFTASHDGVGVRPLEGLISRDRLAGLLENIHARGGLVSTRRQPDGTDAPYELNISYVSALGSPGDERVELHARRFLTSQGLMLALRGMPAIYFHSLVGTPNDLEAAQQSGQPRRINRRKFRRDQLTARLADPSSLQAQIFDGYRHLLSVRRRQPAFHPDAPQDACPCDDPQVVAFWRTSLDQRQRILVLANVGNERRRVDLSLFPGPPLARDLLSDQPIDSTQQMVLDPCGLVWLEAR
jgi:sucrose phosphorylase